MSTEADADGSPVADVTPAASTPTGARGRRDAIAAVALTAVLAVVAFAVTRPDHHRPADVATAVGDATTSTTVRLDPTGTVAAGVTTTTPDATTVPVAVGTTDDAGAGDAGADLTTGASTDNTPDPTSTTAIPLPEPVSMAGQVFYSIADAPNSIGVYTAQGINRMPVTGGAEARVFDGQYAMPNLSADGKWLVMNGADLSDGYYPVFYARADGLGPVTRAAEGYMAPVWNPDATRIAALSLTHGHTIDILDRAGNVTASYLPPADDDPYWLAVAWSSDGRTLAATKANGLYTIDVATGTTRLVFADRVFAASETTAVAWSPDNATIAHFDGSHLRLVTVADGTDTTLPTDATAARDPHFTRDGQAVMATYAPRTAQLERIPLDGSPPQLLTPPDHLRAGSAT